MSTPAELAAGLQALAETLRLAADDPAEQVRLLSGLAAFAPAEVVGFGAVDQAMTAMRDAVAAVCRRAAVVGMARAAAASAPRSYDEAVALRDLVCGLLETEILAAGDTGDDASGAALRVLRTAVAEDLTRRAANLAALREVTVPGPLPALVHAYRLYQDLDRAEELAAYAGAADLNFMPRAFQALGR